MKFHERQEDGSFVFKEIFIDPKACISTHGGAGYASGSYLSGDVIICGACGTKIKPPLHTWREPIRYRFLENPIKWLRGEVKGYEEHSRPFVPGWVKGG